MGRKEIQWKLHAGFDGGRCPKTKIKHAAIQHYSDPAISILAEKEIR
jgi:hypothetical protein